MSRSGEHSAVTDRFCSQLTCLVICILPAGAHLLQLCLNSSPYRDAAPQTITSDLWTQFKALTPLQINHQLIVIQKVRLQHVSTLCSGCSLSAIPEEIHNFVTLRCWRQRFVRNLICRAHYSGLKPVCMHFYNCSDFRNTFQCVNRRSDEQSCTYVAAGSCKLQSDHAVMCCF